MSTFEWKDLLTKWSRALIEANDFKDEMPPEVISSGWLGYPGATEEQMRKAELRLGATFPPSYREFLKVTNGWRQLSSFIYNLWSTEEIEWFAVRNQEWVDAYVQPYAASEPVPDKEYFVYGDEQDGGSIRVEYLQTALEVSDTGDSAILLLNPQIVTPQGEWEAWFFATWSSGATRYRSFWEMMQAEYQSFLHLLEDNSDSDLAN